MCPVPAVNMLGITYILYYNYFVVLLLLLLYVYRVTFGRVIRCD